LRRAVPDDAPGIGSVHVRTWRHAYRGIVPNAVLESLDEVRRAAFWRSEIELAGAAHRPWIAATDDSVVGFVCGGRTRDDDGRGTTGEVYAIYVDPECWQRGIGGNLLRHATRDLKAGGYDEATLWVLEANEIARAFYTARGWAPDGARRDETIGGATLTEVRYRRQLA
jgi:ribosomal protein S18 acetylase RimI-like enzyme